MQLLLFSLFSCICVISVHSQKALSNDKKMEELAKSEELIIRNLTKYIDTLQERLDETKKLIKNVRLEYEVTKQSKIDQIGNPIRLYKLTKRFAMDWKILYKDLMESIKSIVL